VKLNVLDSKPGDLFLVKLKIRVKAVEGLNPYLLQ